MPGFRTAVVLAVIALVLGALAGRDYVGNGRAWTLRAKIWFRMALLFAVIAAWLAGTHAFGPG